MRRRREFKVLESSDLDKIRALSGEKDVREIPGFPHYVTTRQGIVYSFRQHYRRTRHDEYLVPDQPRRLKAYHREGYIFCYYALRPARGNSVMLTPVQVVALAFLPPPLDERWRIAYLVDGNLHNICPENIAWAQHTPSQKRFAKLTEQDVEMARTLYWQGTALADIARLFPVGPAAIKAAIFGDSWKHVLTPTPPRKLNFNPK